MSCAYLILVVHEWCIVLAEKRNAKVLFITFTHEEKIGLCYCTSETKKANERIENKNIIPNEQNTSGMQSYVWYGSYLQSRLFVSSLQ